MYGYSRKLLQPVHSIDLVGYAPELCSASDHSDTALAVPPTLK